MNMKDRSTYMAVDELFNNLRFYSSFKDLLQNGELWGNPLKIEIFGDSVRVYYGGSSVLVKVSDVVLSKLKPYSSICFGKTFLYESVDICKWGIRVSNSSMFKIFPFDDSESNNFGYPSLRSCCRLKSGRSDWSQSGLIRSKEVISIISLLCDYYKDVVVGKVFMDGDMPVCSIYNTSMHCMSIPYRKDRFYVDHAIETLVEFVNSFGRPIKDIYWFGSDITSMRVKHNEDGEYTVVLQ